MDEQPSERLVVISADAHAGAEMTAYKDYLPRELHDDFESWAASFHDPWLDMDAVMTSDEDADLRMGRVSFVSPYSWEGETRLRHMDHEGIAAEVLFPNTVPPFFPSGVISCPAPGTAEEYRYRWAGIKAHNRWLADFCAEAPDRRIGIIQVFLNDLDETLAEIRRGAEHGLKGVLMPMDHLSRLVNVYEPRLDPFWALCQELGLPVHRHTLTVAESEDAFGPGATAIGAHEVHFFVNRAFAHLVFGGVLERFPDTKFVVTESSVDWVPAELRRLDVEIAMGRDPDHRGNPVFARAAAQLSRTATQYFERNVWLGASLMQPRDMTMRHDIGVDKIMWGGDYPHTEGTYPHGELGMRVLFEGLPEDEVRRMVCDNAAQVYDVNMPALERIAAEIGPTIDELTRPVDAAELPKRTLSVTIGAAVDAAARARATAPA